MTEQQGNRFTRYFPLLLDALRSSDPTPMRPAEAWAWIQSHTAVAEADLSRRIANGGQTIFENDVHWVRFYLAKAGLISSPKRGLWGLTPAGRRTHLTADSTWGLYVRIRDANRPGAADEDATAAPEVDPDGEGIAYWFVGALWAGAEDQAERFRAEGSWVSEKLKDHILRMKLGDRIAIKAAFVKKLHVPFDVGGASVAERVTALNTKISEAPSLGPQFRIGHSYVTPEQDEQVGDGRDWFLARVESEIAPLLEEYWYDAPETAKDARAALIQGF